MKKTMLAVALLGAFAGSALAADVTLYGKIDTGLNYQHNTKAGNSTDTLKMATGQSAGNRFGLKGTEDLGDGWKVGFILENGFDADSGALKTYKNEKGGYTNSKLFGREASLNVTSDFGKLTFGRTGALSSGLTSTDVVAGFMAFGTGYGDNTSAMGHFSAGDRTRMDNTVTYQTPRFAGVRVSAQYSFNFNDQEAAGNERQNKRYAGLGVDYANGPFTAGLVVDTVLNQHGTYTVNNVEKVRSYNTEDSLGVTLGAAYDFEVAKVFGIAGYGQNENKMGAYSSIDADNKEGVTGYWAQLGVTAPVAGGKVLASVSYSDVEDEIDSNDTAKAWGVALGYQYSISKRTYAYGFAGYNQSKADDGAKTRKTYETEVGFGLCHNF